MLPSERLMMPESFTGKRRYVSTGRFWRGESPLDRAGEDRTSCRHAMRISDRYIGKQVLLGTVYAILVLSLVLVLGNLFKQIRPLLVDQQAPIGLVMRFVINVLPFSLMFTIPWGFLSAVLLVFGRLSSDQEITSFRVAGVSLVRLAAPVFVIGAVLSAACLWLNVNVVPQAKATLTDLIYEEVKRDPRALLDPGVVQSSFKNQKVFVEGRDGDSLTGFHLYQVPKADDLEAPPGAYVHAGRVSLVVDEGKKELRLKLNDASIEARRADGGVDMVFMEEVEPWVFDFSDARKRKSRASAMTNQEILDYVATEPELSEEKRVNFRAEITKRYSFSMACLAFACVAVPLGLKSRRKDTSTGLVMSLLLGAGYFLFTVLADEFDTDLGAATALWAPNVICVLVGFILFRRARFK